MLALCIVVMCCAFSGACMAAACGFGSSLVFQMLWSVLPYCGVEVDGVGDPVLALAILIVLNCTNSGPLIFMGVQDIQWNVVATILPPMLLFTPLGSYALVALPSTLLAYLLGLLFVTFPTYKIKSLALDQIAEWHAPPPPLDDGDAHGLSADSDGDGSDLSLVGFGFEFEDEECSLSEQCESEDDLEEVLLPVSDAEAGAAERIVAQSSAGVQLSKMAIAGGMVAGAGSGILEGMFGSGGPPIVMFFQSLPDLEKSMIRATYQICVASTIIMRLGAAIVFHFYHARLIPVYLSVIPATVCGTYLGNKLHHALPTRAVLALLLMVIFYSAVTLMHPSFAPSAQTSDLASFPYSPLLAVLLIIFGSLRVLYFAILLYRQRPSSQRS